jgi:Fur family peroxide stress response transcriptional regulator
MSMKRYSRKREAILEKIRSTKSHPSAEWVYEELKPDFPDLSLATVYRNIAEFLESGEVASVGYVDSRERFDGDVVPHAHFVCTKCGAVLDVPLPDDPGIDSAASEKLGARVERHEITFRGVCRKCLDMHGPEGSDI